MGSITITNDGGVQVLTEVLQAVMVSTYEQVPTNRYFSRFGFEYDRQYVYCREPEEIVEAKEEQQEQLKGDAGPRLHGLDANAH